MKRRTFLEIAAGLPLVSLAQNAGAAPGEPLRGVIIGDTKQGGYGHSLHLLFAGQPRVKLLALADPDPAGRAKRAKECGVEKTYADYREMLETERPDIVVVGPRSTFNHEAYLVACADIGAHGFIEKPLMADLAAADRAISALEAKHLKWSIAFNYRVTPAVVHLKKVLEDGLIGELLEVRGRGKEDSRAGGEDLIVLGIHLFDILIYLLGSPKSCQAMVWDKGELSTPENVREATESLGPIIGDNVQATFEFPTGIPAYFASKANSEKSVERWGLDFYGTKGIISMRMKPEPHLWLLRGDSWAPSPDDPGWEPVPGAPEMVAKDQGVDHYRPIVDDLLAAIAEDRRPAVSVQDGRAAHEMIQAVWASHVAGRRVSLPLKERAHPLENWTA